MVKSEDAQKTLLYLDVLGFPALTEHYQVRVLHSGPDHGSDLTTSSTSPLQSVINGFARVLDSHIFEEELSGGIQAMLFSDCAFLVYGSSVRAVRAARALMRELIKNGITVRMGLGKGTFYDLEYVTRTDGGSVMVSKSRFIGTAVVHAHNAEKCGGKGMRIFIDQSVDGGLVGRIKLPNVLKGVACELNYLSESVGPGIADKEDHDLFCKVKSLIDLQFSADVRTHYTDTLDAMNRMRAANNRAPIEL